jgi:hypothetical protein
MFLRTSLVAALAFTGAYSSRTDPNTNENDNPDHIAPPMTERGGGNNNDPNADKVGDDDDAETYEVVSSEGQSVTTDTRCASTRLNLASSEDFVILSKAGVTNVPNSMIVGDMGVSPIAHTSVTGFSLSHTSVGDYATSSQVDGHVYGANHLQGTPVKLTTAVHDMEAAYTEAAGRANTFPQINYKEGSIGGLTLFPDVYTWMTPIIISKDVTLFGDECSVFILRTTGNLYLGPHVKVLLSGGVQAANVFWQVAGSVEIQTSAHMVGTILGKTSVSMLTGASMEGRIFSQTATTLQMNVITESDVFDPT